MQSGALGTALADRDFELGPEVDSLLENDPQAASAHVESPALEDGRRRPCQLQPPRSRLEGHPCTELVARSPPACRVDVTRGLDLRKRSQATAVFHGQPSRKAARYEFPQYHAAADRHAALGATHEPQPRPAHF